MIYSARYSDRSGQETATLTNDGKRMSLLVRGVTFVGDDFDSLETDLPLDSPELSSFALQKGDLVDFELEFEMPIIVVKNGDPFQSTLQVHFTLGKILPNGRIDKELFHLVLLFEDETISSCGEHGWFEDEMIEIQKELPSDTYMKCCFNCAYSDYFPAGSGSFGDLACFRDNKAEYLKVQDKYDLFEIWDSRTEFVQETWLCPEFDRRASGAGYRG